MALQFFEKKAAPIRRKMETRMIAYQRRGERFCTVIPLMLGESTSCAFAENMGNLPHTSEGEISISCYV
ncbi:hypothetical protein ERHA55_11930 [Erwinia rhapontici]|nr:hypothetical protein ERHA55_11930 [Erwinia rhapontici]